MGSALGVGYQDPNNRQQTQQQQPTEEPPTRGKYYFFSVKSISRILLLVLFIFNLYRQ